MKKYIYGVILLLAGACTADLEDTLVNSGNTDTADKIINNSTYAVNGEVLVRFEPSAESRLAECATRSGATRSGIEGVDITLDRVGGYAVEPVFVVTEKNCEKVYAAGLHLWYLLKFDENQSLDNVAADLAKVGEVKYVEFVRKVKRIAPKRATGFTSNNQAAKTSPTSETRATTSIPFNDPHKQYMWGLDNQGTNSMVGYENLFKPETEADVNAVPAWKLCTGNPSIVVAIVDEGVMYSHEDLKDNYLINLAEKNGTAGKDDDGNGYIDDIYGYNFVSRNATISWNKNGDTGHGTHVGGIVSAVNNNNTGICSIAGGSGNNDGVKIFSSQIFSGENGATTTNTAKSIQYAADRGAHILQCSWGYEGGEITNDKDYTGDYYCSIEADAIDYFIANGGTDNGPIAGGLAIFAAGNEFYPMAGYPGAYEPCISVASIGPALKPTYYTNYNYGVDITAPGGSSLYPNGEIYSTVPSVLYGSNYAMMQGTSMACPMVSGVAALGLSYAQKLGKRFTAKEFRSMLLASTSDISPYLTGSITIIWEDNTEDDINYADYKEKMGAGYVDAYKLLLQVEGTPYVTIIANKASSIDLTQFFGNGDLRFSKYEISDSDKSAVGWSNDSYSNGKLNVTCTKSGSATVTVTMLVGTGSQSNASNPYPTEITKSFVVMVRSKLASNNGWL